MAGPDREALRGRFMRCADQQAELDGEMQLLADSVEALIDHAGPRVAEVC